MSKATVEALSELHGVVATELTRRISANEASAADIGAAIKFLKDNSITASIEDNSQLQDLQERLAEKARKRHLRSVPAPETPITDDEAEEIIQGIARSA